MAKATSRTITTHPTDSCGFTDYAQRLCQALNVYKRLNPDATFVEMAGYWYGATGQYLSAKSISRYYYGAHSLNDFWGKGTYLRVRRGAMVTI